ncbi:unnamed protein product [Parnassius mnemosyne]|uniref:Digestive organ expansion factor homolog n=1 Tax=Parnassius mnemosyne TaxID=213953 RepID=A0AAV1KPH5_9NEOP
MGKSKKFFVKKRKGFKSVDKKRKKLSKETEFTNKKAIFNRYKNKQKVEEELAKKKLLEQKFQQKHFSESEEDEDTLSQLVSCFSNPSKNDHIVDSDQSSESIKNDVSDSENDSLKNEIDDIAHSNISNQLDESTRNDPILMNNEECDLEPDEEIVDDPFTKHFQYDLSDELMVSLSNAISTVDNVTKVWPILDIFTPLQKELFAIINNYQDMYYPERTFSNADEIRYTYCLHVVNHVLKTRTKILHHNAKLSKKFDMSDEYRDQGLVRPKVLIMVPFKDAAYRVVKTLIDILVPKEAGQVVNKNRFEDDFTGGELLMPTKNPKPEDYELLFSGNTEDTFRLGMTLTKKTLKLYTDFYSSDILIASPLGLRMIVGAEGEEDRDYDFLASIEILIMDQADVFLMQNWDHLLHVLDHFHLQPKKTHDTDFSRVRSWAVNGWAKYYRQTLIFSSVSLPEIKSVMNRKCQNYAGKVFITNPIAIGSIQQVLLQVPQLFHRFNATSPLASVDGRFDYFTKEILPKQRDTLMSHTLIYVPSYFDFVRIRNYFKKEDIGFVQICEYSKDAKIARARDMFFHTEAHFLLYSERVHFFRRFRIKGIRHIIFYQPPTYPHFYSEMCNLMQESNQNKYGGSECNMTVTTLHCKYDAQRMAAVLGAARFARIAASDKSVHMYVTGE